MSKQNKQARDDADYYHFDIHGVRDAGFSTFNHDYVPQLAPIKANLAQDLPQSVKDFSPGTLTSVVDPYLPIAKLRKQFEGKRVMVGGFELKEENDSLGTFSWEGSKSHCVLPLDRILFRDLPITTL